VFTTIFFGVGMFTAVVVALVMVILAARSKLVASGNINIQINGEKTIQVPAGGNYSRRSLMRTFFLRVPVVAVVLARSANVSCLRAVAHYCPRKRVISPAERRTRVGDSLARHRLNRI